MPGNKKNQEEMGGGGQRMLFITWVGRDDWGDIWVESHREGGSDLGRCLSKEHSV